MAQKQSQEDQAALAALLTADLDDLADLPAFTVFPPGNYDVSLGLATKMIGEHPSVEATLTLVAVCEMADPTQTPPAVGDECNTAFMMDNEIGQGKFKEFAQPLKAHFGVSKIGDLAGAIKGCVFNVTTNTRVDKKSKREYLEIIKLLVK